MDAEGWNAASDRARAGEGALFYHGGNLGAARQCFPGAPDEWIDLSTGINPVPYPVGDVAAEDWARLPDASALADLVLAACERYGAPSPECVVAAPGTQALLQWLPRLLPARRVAVVGFTYAEHARCWAAAGSEVTVVDDLGAVDGFGAAVVVNPNNPDGRLTTSDALLDAARRIASRGGTFVVDEAFMDVLPKQESVAARVAEIPGLVVLRSFGKAYGLAGLRLGFALAAPDLAARLRNAVGPWAVAGPALTIGRQALRDEDWLERTRQRLAADRRRLEHLLTASGLRPVGGTPLFVLASHPEARMIFERLGNVGVLTRAFSDRPEWLRFGLAPASQWPTLEHRLESF
jgi:cobalamin biosynthetic protein CobC